MKLPARETEMKPYFKVFWRVATRNIKAGGEAALSFFGTTRPLKILLYIIGLIIFLTLTGQIRW